MLIIKSLSSKVTVNEDKINDWTIIISFIFASLKVYWKVVIIKLTKYQTSYSKHTIIRCVPVMLNGSSLMVIIKLNNIPVGSYEIANTLPNLELEILFTNLPVSFGSVIPAVKSWILKQTIYMGQLICNHWIALTQFWSWLDDRWF